MQRRRRRARLGFECLEPRLPLAGDLAVVDAYLANLNADRIDAVVEGQRTIVRVNYRMTNLTTADNFVIRFELDGQPFESATFTGQPGNNLFFYRYYAIGYSAPGLRNVRVILDSNNQISETNEANNEFSFQYVPEKPQLAQKFMMPLDGNYDVDWTILNLHDVDIRDGSRRDFSGGFLQYENHQGWDLFLPNFASMDRGVPVMAAADGIVIKADDGNFDRENFWDFTLPDPRIANTVWVQHADGWVTGYHHLMRDSVAVEVGQTVTAGQILGLVASSGITDGAHVHFTISLNSMPVEPMYALNEYFVDPPTYLGSQTPRATAFGIADRDPVPDFKEFANDIRTFVLNGATRPWLWYRLEYIRSGQVLTTRWYRPDGSLYLDGQWTSQFDTRYLKFWTRSQGVNAVGEWTVVALIDDVELFRTTYNVVTGAGAPEIDLRQDDTYIIDGRSTPIEFETVEKGSASPTKSFTISNHGTAPLTLTDFQLPQGFSFASAVPQSVSPGASTSFSIAMNTDAVDHLWGDVRFHTNDSDEPSFTFPLEGYVSGQAPPNAAVLSHPRYALGIQDQLAVQPVFPEIVVSSGLSTSWSQSRIVSRIAAGGDDLGSDRLVFYPLAPALSLYRDVISYNGNPVAHVVKDGRDGELEIQFGDAATQEIIEAVTTAISFWSQREDPESRKRIISLQLITSNNVASNTVYRASFYSHGAFEHPPTIATLTDRTVNEDGSLTSLPLGISDLNQPPQSLTVQAVSSNPSLVHESGLHTYFMNGSWVLDAVPTQDGFGNTTITVRVTDSAGNEASSSFDLEVVSVNDLPELSVISNQTIEQDSSTPPIAFQISDIETAAGQLQVSAASSNLQLIDVSGITLAGSGSSRTIRLTPKPGETGQSVITVTVLDLDGGTSDRTFTLRVNPESIPPTISTIAGQEQDEDSTLEIPFSIDDNATPASDLLVTVQSNNTTLFPANRMAVTGTGNNRTLLLSPASNLSGQAIITVRVTDAANNTTNRSFLVKVLPVNDPPEFAAPTSASTTEDSDAVSTSIFSISSGPLESQSLAWSVEPESPEFFESIQVLHSPPSSSGSLVWKPAPNISGTTTVQIILSDAGLDNDLATVEDNLQKTQWITLTITPVNDPPTLVGPSSLSMNEDASLQHATFNNVSPGPNEVQPIQVVVRAAQNDFFAELNAHYDPDSHSIAVDYRPTENRFGNTSLYLDVTDGGLDQNLATSEDNAVTTHTIAVEVQAVNDEPTFELTIPSEILEDAGELFETIVSVSAGPFEDDELHWAYSWSPESAISTFQILPGASPDTRQLKWQTTANYHGDIELEVVLSDPGSDQDPATKADNLSATKTFSVAVTPVNDPPTQIQLPTGNISEHASGHSFGAVDVLDADENDVHTFSFDDDRFDIVDGILISRPTAIFDYESEPTITLQITASDASMESITGSTTITIDDANDPPSAISIDHYRLFPLIQGQIVGPVIVEDQDVGQSHSLVSLDDRFEVVDGLLQLRPSASIPDDMSEVTISVRVTDSGTPPISADLQMTLIVTPIASPWRNPSLPYDVNNDRRITPIDALIVINFLNRRGGDGTLDEMTNPPKITGPFWDANGDRRVTPIDALVVLNFLSREIGGSEGESETPYSYVMPFANAVGAGNDGCSWFTWPSHNEELLHKRLLQGVQ